VAENALSQCRGGTAHLKANGTTVARASGWIVIHLCASNFLRLLWSNPGMTKLSRADWIAAGVIGVLSALLLYGLQHTPPLSGVPIQSSAPGHLP
jgi:hypothetical protein